MWFKRHASEHLDIFNDKLLIVYGPRQCGKTAFINHHYKPDINLNMDLAEDRLAFKKLPFSLEKYSLEHKNKKAVIFIDEIHKARNWRNLIKGIFDKWNKKFRFVVSGSSAFELQKQDRGDSLAGRVAWLEMTPLTFREYFSSLYPRIKLPPPWDMHTPLKEHLADFLKFKNEIETAFKNYEKFGSFPENLAKHNTVAYAQWLKAYTSALLNRDLRDLAGFKDTERVYHVFTLLMEGLGNTYSMRNMAETLSVSVDTVKSDILALSKVMWGSNLSALSGSRTRQIQREKKFYPADFCFLNYAAPQMAGALLETQTFLALNRHLVYHSFGKLTVPELGYYRDYNQREMDFVISYKKNIVLAVECKINHQKGIKNLRFMGDHLRPKEIIKVVEAPVHFEIHEPYTSIGVGLLMLGLY